VTLRIVLAEDHQIVREGLKSLLAGADGCEVVGEIGEGLGVESLVAQCRPDVLVVDVVMPGLNGIEVTRRVRRGHSETRVVVLSMHADRAFVVEAFRAGASGYVLKDTTATELIQAIQAASAGRRYLSPPLPPDWWEGAADPARDEGIGDPYSGLTAREREVLQLVAEGWTSRQVGEYLGVSRRTVEAHRANLMAKLGVPSAAGLVRFVAERGLLPGGSPAPRLDRQHRSK
jgi:DNA-binding NarL/FixJ family response regulator